MYEIFHSNFTACIGPILNEAARYGASYYPGALRLSVCKAMAEEANSQPYTVLAPDFDKPVIEDLDLLKVPLDFVSFPLLSFIGRELATLAHPHIQQLCDKSWTPNEAAVHRYHAGSQGLSAHRDFKSDQLLIAVFTVHGCGKFELLANDLKVLHSWDCAPGGLCLMRAPGLTGSSHDDRPLHRALAPDKGYRQSVIYRQINA